MAHVENFKYISMDYIRTRRPKILFEQLCDSLAKQGWKSHRDGKDGTVTSNIKKAELAIIGDQ